MSEQAVDANAIVSHTDDRGRTLSGVGADADKLAETMERHAPAPAEKPAAVTPPADGAPPATTEPPPSRGRQRFADLTRERDEAKAAAEAAKAEREQFARERDEIRARFEAAEKARTEPPKEPSAPEPKQPTRPEPDVEEIGTKYQTFNAFLTDHAKWVLEQQEQPDYEQSVREVLNAERARQEFQTAVQSSQDRARKAYADFDTLLKSPTGQIALGKSAEESFERVNFIMRHPQSEHVQYAILKDAALAQRLQQASAYEFGQIVAGLVPAAAPAKPAWTPPPAPYTAVGGSAATVPTSSSEIAKKGGNFDEYREKRSAELGRKVTRWK